MAAFCPACGRAVPAVNGESASVCPACGKLLRTAGSAGVVETAVTRPIDDSYLFPPGFSPPSPPPTPARPSSAADRSPGDEVRERRSAADGPPGQASGQRVESPLPTPAPRSVPAAIWQAAWPPTATPPTATPPTATPLPALGSPSAEVSRHASPIVPLEPVTHRSVAGGLGSSWEKALADEPVEHERERVTGGSPHAQPPLPPPPPTRSVTPTPSRKQDWIPPGLGLDSSDDTSSPSSGSYSSGSYSSGSNPGPILGGAHGSGFSAHASPGSPTPRTTAAYGAESASAIASTPSPPMTRGSTATAATEWAQGSAEPPLQQRYPNRPQGEAPESSAEQLAWLEQVNQRARRKLLKNLVIWTLCALALVIFFWAMLAING